MRSAWENAKKKAMLCAALEAKNCCHITSTCGDNVNAMEEIQAEGRLKAYDGSLKGCINKIARNILTEYKKEYADLIQTLTGLPCSKDAE